MYRGPRLPVWRASYKRRRLSLFARAKPRAENFFEFGLRFLTRSRSILFSSSQRSLVQASSRRKRSQRPRTDKKDPPRGPNGQTRRSLLSKKRPGPKARNEALDNA